MPRPSIGPCTTIETPGPCAGSMPGVEPDPPQVGAQLVDRRVAALGRSGRGPPSSRSSVAISPRSWSLRSLRLATSTVRSCDDRPANAVPARLGPELDDDEQAEQRSVTAAIVSWLPAATHPPQPCRAVRPGAAGEGSGRA